MLKRKISKKIQEYFKEKPNKILIIDGARQVGKSFIIQYEGEKYFKNFININLQNDLEGNKIYSNIRTIEDFYFKISIQYGKQLGDYEDTCIFLDEIQSYPNLLTLLKFLNQDRRYRFIVSGSLLGISLYKTPSIPIGSIEIVQMYPLDFEEFLYATGASIDAIEYLKTKFINKETLDISLHDDMMFRFKRYLIVGGMPDAVNSFINENNLFKIRTIQANIYEMYKDDSSEYDFNNKLNISKMYDLVSSNLENKKKRYKLNNIENKKGASYRDYHEEFEYLIDSGICIEINAVSNPKFPLIQSNIKNLLKLYYNDVGIFSNILYGENPNAILNDISSINLGSLYETVVAMELKNHHKKLYYYDNRSNGEVDFIIDDFMNLSILPIKVKSGRDYMIHSALNNLLKDENYNVKKAIVLSNEREIKEKNNIIYYPIYYMMFL